MLNNNEKTGRDGVSRATRKDSNLVDGSALRVRVMAAIGRAALWGLLPLKFADKLIRRMRRSA